MPQYQSLLNEIEDKLQALEKHGDFQDLLLEWIQNRAAGDQSQDERMRDVGRVVVHSFAYLKSLLSIAKEQTPATRKDEVKLLSADDPAMLQDMVTAWMEQNRMPVIAANLGHHPRTGAVILSLVCQGDPADFGDAINQSLHTGRMIESDYEPLQYGKHNVRPVAYVLKSYGAQALRDLAEYATGRAIDLEEIEGE